MKTIIINFKTYQKATGERGVHLAKICEKVSKETKVKIIIAVQNSDLFRISSKVSIPIYAEHVDPITYGSHTGQDLPETLVENGASGVLINHSEDPEELIFIESSIKRCKEVGMETVVCAPSAKTSEAMASLDPDFVAMEPPELIGGDVSVATAAPDIIKETVELVKKNSSHVPILCGAGIKNKEDVRVSIKLGCEGILVASGITQSQDPETALRNLISGFD